MSEVITKHCVLLEQMKQNNEYDVQDGDDILQDFQTELIRLQSSDQVIFRREMNKVTGLLNDKVLNLNQLILTYFLNYFTQLLKQWYALTAPDDLNTFENLTNIFVTYSDTLMNELFVQEFRSCLEKIGQTGKELFSNPNIPIVTRLLRTCTLIESDNKYRFMDVSPYDEPILKCLCAPYTTEVFTLFKSSVTSEERTATEKFVFDGLFDHVSIMNRQQLEKQSFQLREHLLPSLSHLLDTFLISSSEWSESAMTILTDSTTLFLYSVQMTIPNDICLDIQKHICATAIQVLLSATYRPMKFNNNCLQYIYMGTLHDKILDYLKGEQLTSTMFQILNLYKDESEIQFNIYRILAAIMTEEDIKRLDDPGAIAHIFLESILDIRDRSGWETRLRNLLATLKILLQHDQIRDEIYRQDGIPLFIYCATQNKYDALIQQRALENLLIMSFNESVCFNLKENTSFMSHIESLSQNSTQSDLQRAGESLLWILTKNDDASKSSTNDQSLGTNYDIMISYSHKDKDLCFQLYDRLKKDRFRVWLDRDEMHGTPLESMSNAIEKSEFVFICMSDAYKQSGYCKMEAYYALERQCTIIPLVMKAQYRPDGWLGIIVTGRMRVDFPKYGFEDAYRNLMNEIDRNRKEKNTENPSHHHHEIVPVTKSSNNSPVKENQTIERVVFQAKSDHTLLSNIEQWTVDDVQQFFIKRNLESFLAICARMNGTRLVGLYRMCITNSPVMLQSLNHQLAATKLEEEKNVIEVDEYLQFLEDLKPFVPVLVEKKEINVSQSSACFIL